MPRSTQEQGWVPVLPGIRERTLSASDLLPQEAVKGRPPKDTPQRGLVGYAFNCPQVSVAVNLESSGLT